MATTTATGAGLITDEFRAAFRGELIEPGLVPIQDWRPDPNDPGEPLDHHWFVGGVARKR